MLKSQNCWGHWLKAQPSTWCSVINMSLSWLPIYPCCPPVYSITCDVVMVASAHSNSLVNICFCVWPTQLWLGLIKVTRWIWYGNDVAWYCLHEMDTFIVYTVLLTNKQKMPILSKQCALVPHVSGKLWEKIEIEISRCDSINVHNIATVSLPASEIVLVKITFESPA